MDFHFFLLGVNLGFLGTLCLCERGQVVIVEDGTTFLFLFLFSASEREKEKEVYVLGRKREKSQLRNDWDSS